MITKKHLGWLLRFALAIVGGFLGRMAWEQQPAWRLATGLALKAATANSTPRAATADADRRSGRARFSLDAIAAADDAAGALREWRERLESLSPTERGEWMAEVVEATGPGFRTFFKRLATDTALRKELAKWGKMIENIVNGPSSKELITRAFVELARIDLALALDGAEASGLPETMDAVLAVMADDDPRALLVLASQREISPGLQTLAIQSLAARSSEEAKAALQGLPERTARAAGLAIARQLLTTNPGDALALGRGTDGKIDGKWVDELTNGLRPEQTVAVIKELESSDPDAFGTMSQNLMANLGRAMALADPERALEWAESQFKQDAGRQTIYLGVLEGLGDNSPEIVAPLLSTLPPGRAVDDALARAMRYWFAKDPGAAVNWWLTQPATTNEAVIRRWFYGFPTQASTQMASRLRDMPDSPAKERIGIFVANELSADDPAAGWQFASEVLTGSSQAAAQGQAFANWLKTDSKGALAHMTELSPEARTQALTALVLRKPKSLVDNPSPIVAMLNATEPESLAALNPPAAAAMIRLQLALGRNTEALTQANAITDSAERERALRTVGQAASAGFDLAVAAQAFQLVKDPTTRLQLERDMVLRSWHTQ